MKESGLGHRQDIAGKIKPYFMISDRVDGFHWTVFCIFQPVEKFKSHTKVL